MSTNRELSCVFDSGLLTERLTEDLKALDKELLVSWSKRQIFRTETEARCSVLNDFNHPTKASKYWQAVREQSAMLEALIGLSFEYRKNDVELRRAQQKLKAAKDDLELELAQVEVDEKTWAKINMEVVGADRVRELKMWSKIKKELDDGSFDIDSPDTHQMESLYQTLIHRAKSLGSMSSEAEVVNVLGPLNTMERMRQVGTRPDGRKSLES